MPPQQPYNQPNQAPQVEQTPYDFILNADHSPKGGGSSSMKQRLLFVGGVFGLLIVLGLIMVAILSGGGSNSDVYLRVQQVQAETARVSQLAVEDVGSQTVRNAAINTQLAATTDQQLLSAALAGQGISFTPEQLLLGQNAEVATTFEQAQAAGTLDSTALTYLQEQVAIYETALAEAYAQANSPELQAELQRAYDAVKLLNTQLTATTP